MSELTKETIEQLKHEHGEVHKLSALGETIVVKTPTGPIFDRFKEYGSDPERRTMANVKLVGDCLVWPPRAEFDEMIRRRPGLTETFGNEVAEIGGLTRKVEREKL